MNYRVLEWIFVATLLYTAADVKKNVCWALCRQDGYDLGYFETKTNSCICGVRKLYRQYTEKQLKVITPKETPKNPFWYDDN